MKKSLYLLICTIPLWSGITWALPNFDIQTPGTCFTCHTDSHQATSYDRQNGYWLAPLSIIGLEDFPQTEEQIVVRS